MSRHRRPDEVSLEELERRLRAAGEAPAPEPRARFAELLEDRLRAGVGPAPQPLAPPARSRPRRWAPAPTLAAVASVALLFTGVAVLQSGDGTEQLRVATATDALVVLPDGTVDTAAAGQVVSDGTRLVTGDEGQVTAGDVELGPNREGRVKGGALRPTPTTAPPPASVDPPPPVAPPAVSPPAGTDPEPGGTVTPAPGPGRPDPEPVSPTTQPTPTEPRPTTPTASDGPVTTSPREPAVAEMKLVARFRDTAVRLNWTAYEGPGFAAYLVLRSDGPHEPRYPLDERTTVVARITDRNVVTWTDKVADPAGRVYRVVAVDAQRRLLGRTPAVRPQPVTTETRTASTSPGDSPVGATASR